MNITHPDSLTPEQLIDRIRALEAEYTYHMRGAGRCLGMKWALEQQLKNMMPFEVFKEVDDLFNQGS